MSGKESALSNDIQRALGWVEGRGGLEDVFTSEEPFIKERSPDEIKDYAKRGLVYVCGVTPNDVINALYLHGKTFGINPEKDVNTESLYTSTSVRIIPGTLLRIEGKDPIGFLKEVDLPLNFNADNLPELLRYEGQGTIFPRHAYVAVLQVTNPLRLLSQDLDDPFFTLRGPRGIILEPTVVDWVHKY